METTILKGESAKERILTETKSSLRELTNRYGKTPGIAFIGFEGVPLAKYTIPLHVQLARELGFEVVLEMKPEEVTESELFNLIDRLNVNNNVHAVVILQPVPIHLNAMRISNQIVPEKEVEGFHPLNMLGTLLPEVIPNEYPMCLPAALGEIFKEAGIRPGKNDEWVFLLDDEFLENPLTKMIVHTAALKVVPNDCPVTFLTRNSSIVIECCKKADYLVIVTKHPEYVKPEWLKPGVCIIDIYSNLVKEIPSKNDPSKLVPIIRGGISAESAKNIASAILPVPGGLMTTVLAILFHNAMLAFKNKMS
jgi:methylenetetrahydrofolate dehydrogenase (NADP+)/methenyltetrahydrofolate cyclohydrolase